MKHALGCFGVNDECSIHIEAKNVVKPPPQSSPWHPLLFKESSTNQQNLTEMRALNCGALENPFRGGNHLEEIINLDNFFKQKMEVNQQKNDNKPPPPPIAHRPEGGHLPLFFEPITFETQLVTPSPRGRESHDSFLDFPLKKARETFRAPWPLVTFRRFLAYPPFCWAPGPNKTNNCKELSQLYAPPPETNFTPGLHEMCAEWGHIWSRPLSYWNCRIREACSKKRGKQQWDVLRNATWHTEANVILAALAGLSSSPTIKQLPGWVVVSSGAGTLLGTEDLKKTRKLNAWAKMKTKNTKSGTYYQQNH